MNFRTYISFAICALYAAGSAQAVTLATRGELTVTTDEFYAYHFMSAPSKVETLRASPMEVQSTITEVLAPRSYRLTAPTHDKLDPLERRYVELQLERAPLLADLNVHERRARAAFSANDAVTVERAKEIWQTDINRFVVDENADITQIFFDFKLLPFAQVIARIAEAEKALANGEAFDVVLQKYSDDKSAKEHGGKLMKVRASGTDALLGNVIFKTLKEGEVSQPTPSRIGIHIVRLDKKRAQTKRAFEEVKGSIIEQLLEETVKKVRLTFLENVSRVATVVNEKAFDDFLLKPDPALDQKRRELIRDVEKQTIKADTPDK